MDEREGVPPEEDAFPGPVVGGAAPQGPGVAALGQNVWLVLGGGGMKGLAHVGVWRALTEAGVRIEGIVGTSIGALVGALIAAGTAWEGMRTRALTIRREDIVLLNRRVAWINGIRQISVFRGDTLRAFFATLLPAEGWSALDRPVLINAVDLGTGRTEWFGPGARTDVSLLDAVYASAALPVFYPPAVFGSQAFVDGGTEHPLGLACPAAKGASGLIGVDVGSGELGKTPKILRQGMLAVHQRIFSIMTYRRRRDLVASWSGPPLLYVRPRLEGYETFDFDHVEYFLDEGYRATQQALQGNAEVPAP